MKGLDLERLQAYLDSPPLTAKMFAGGRSNLTYAVTDGVDRWVLRRPPLHKRANSDETMRREARMLAALAQTG